MCVNPKLCLLVLFALSLSYKASAADNEQTEDPWKVYERCRSGCDKQQGSSMQLDQCIKTCQRQYDEMMKHRHGGDCGCGRQECSRRRDCRCGHPDCRCGGGTGIRQGGSGGDCGCGSSECSRRGDCRCGHPDCRCGGGTENRKRPAEERLKECRSRCMKEEEGQRRDHCERKCQRKFEKQKKEEGGGGGSRNNPYFFDSQWSGTNSETGEGRARVLERFGESSEELLGIDNYRVANIEANPNTFVLPHHYDAEAIFAVLKGRGAVSMVLKNERQTHKLKDGDVIRVPAGALVYFTNSDDNERMHLLGLIQPINAPGEFQDFVGVGEDSYYRRFSREILEAAFKTPMEKLKRFFRQNEKVAIMKASKQQIQALSQESESSSKERRKQKWSPIHLLNQTPLFSSRFGQYLEASPNDHDQLKDLDVAVGFMNITRRGMILPYYNSRATEIAFVAGGSGYLEIAGAGYFEKKNSRVSEESEHGDIDVPYVIPFGAELEMGDVVVVPAGHPVTFMASDESGLELAIFGIKGASNQKQFLAGKENVWKEVEVAAKELSFGAGAEAIFERQDESYFVRRPAGREEGKKRRGVASILEFGGF